MITHLGCRKKRRRMSSSFVKQVFFMKGFILLNIFGWLFLEIGIAKKLVKELVKVRKVEFKLKEILGGK